MHSILFENNFKLPSDLNIISEPILNNEIFNYFDNKVFEDSKKKYYISYSIVVYPLDGNYSSEYKQHLESLIQLFLEEEDEFKNCIMIITEICIKHISYGNLSNTYPDNEANFIYTLIIRLHDDKKRLKMFTVILDSIYETFKYDYIKTYSKFNQRPYFKLFYTFISLFDYVHICSEGFNYDNAKKQCIEILGEFLLKLSPFIFPGFALAWLELISSHIFINSFFKDNYDDDNLYSLQKKENADISIYFLLMLEIFRFLNNFCHVKVNEAFMYYIYKFFFYFQIAIEFYCSVLLFIFFTSSS